MKKNLLKLIDRLVGSFLITCLPSVAVQTFSRHGHFLIIRPGGIGDAVLLLPMLKQLADLYPNAVIEVLAEKRNAEVFRWSPVVTAVWCYDKPAEFLKLFTRKFDLIIDTEQWYRLSAVVARLLAPSRLIGFGANERSRLLTDPCPYTFNEYEAIVFGELLAPIAGSGFSVLVEASRFMNLPIPDSGISQPYVVISPGTSIAAKQWSVERFSEVASYCERCGFDVVVLGGKGDEGVGQSVSCALSRCHNLVGRTSLTESASIVSGARLMISGDSGLLHVAQLQGVPTVALFGPSDPEKWSRKGDRHSIVSAGIDCAPCSRFGTIPKCPHGFRCMQNITVEMVVEAVKELRFCESAS
ncbi:MAG: glycosyltransferase family 9 protein [Geobacteraceae bacterium]|nr:glycosyltransferase family 9 protein [Geobacteraceae bacterium]